MEADIGRLKTVRLTTPVSDAAIAALELGDIVYLAGRIYTGREMLYQAIVTERRPPPVDLKTLGNVNFHCSPAAVVRDDGSYVVGAVTGTASFRFTKWLPEWFRISGCKVIIGKGGMSEADYKSIFVPAGAIYLTTVGYGTGALLGRGIKAVKAYLVEEFGIAQALWVFEVVNFGPFLVEGDRHGNSLFEAHNRRLDDRITKLLARTTPPALGRFGETGDPTDELI